MVLGLLWSGSAYANCIQGNCNNGTGIYVSKKNGNKWEGEFKNRKRHGQGIMTYTNGSKYIGEYKNNKRHGQGIYFYNNGDKYEGEFRENKRHGQGIYTYNNGDIYEGIFEYGKFKEVSKSKKNSQYNDDKYAICYGEMTKAHKARGFHQRNRMASIEVKETICKAYANGEINNYEGKR